MQRKPVVEDVGVAEGAVGDAAAEAAVEAEVEAEARAGEKEVDEAEWGE